MDGKRVIKHVLFSLLIALAPSLPVISAAPSSETCCCEDQSGTAGDSCCSASASMATGIVPGDNSCGCLSSSDDNTASAQPAAASPGHERIDTEAGPENPALIGACSYDLRTKCTRSTLRPPPPETCILLCSLLC